MENQNESLYPSGLALDAYMQSMIYMYSMSKPKSERVPKGKIFWQLIVDESLQRKFKARCIEAGKTMSDQIEELVRDWLKR